MAKAGEVFGLAADDPDFDNEITGITTPLGNIPVSDAIGKAPAPEKAESILDKPADSKEDAQVEQKETVEDKPLEGLAMTDDMLILDDRDGKVKPWKEFKGLAVLKKETDALAHGVQREREALANDMNYVAANKPFIDAIGGSTFAVTLANSLKNGVPEDQAIAAAFAASGKVPPGTAAPIKEVDPEPTIPDDFNANDPQHLLAAQKHMQWENRKLASEMAANMVAPIKAELDAFKLRDQQQVAALAQAKANAEAVTAHNRTMLAEIPNFIDFNMAELSPEDQEKFWRKFDESGSKLGIPLENHRLTKAEVAGMVALTAPGGANPFVQPAQPKIPTKIAALPTKAPLGTGTSGGSQSASGSYPVSDRERIQNILEGMSTGKPVEGVPIF